jgi:glycine/D-amino acid oxidase-like deaminating enzyme
MKMYYQYVIGKGAMFLSGTDVVDVGERSNQDNMVSVKVRDPSNKDNFFHLKAKNVAVCTNAFMKEFFKDEEIMPKRDIVLVTSKIENLKAKANFTFYEDCYFRELDGRILIGGVRDLFEESEVNQQKQEVNEDVANFLEKMLREILPGIEF